VCAVSRAAAGEISDRLYADLPKVECIPPAGRWSHMPKTMRALREGTPLHIVMLGDSIINDTFNSNYGALLSRLYPRSRLRITCSVRGGTGCWYYKEDENIKSYVLDLKPDLLMIGGVSHRNDTESIREVIRKTRQQLPDCEILLMSGPFGQDPRKGPTDGVAPMPVQRCPADPFTTELEQLAREQRVEFFDMRTPWAGYLGQSGKPHGWLHRDQVHANDRGKQILGRLLECYFAPARDDGENGKAR